MSHFPNTQKYAGQLGWLRSSDAAVYAEGTGEIPLRISPADIYALILLCSISSSRQNHHNFKPQLQHGHHEVASTTNVNKSMKLYYNA